ncbi:hypothetical protein ACIN5143_A0402 [Acinetobacter baumannii OIFC143]|nr:hypothetical protein [Acinetobacter baumannii]EJG19135.1 hypothetical protein ACIN5143_A0402 [Acinetobacter baumannii OIFC143]
MSNKISYQPWLHAILVIARHYLIGKHPANTALPSGPISLNLVPT